MQRSAIALDAAGLKWISCKFFLLRSVIGKKSRHMKLFR